MPSSLLVKLILVSAAVVRAVPLESEQVSTEDSRGCAPDYMAPDHSVYCGSHDGQPAVLDFGDMCFAGCRQVGNSEAWFYTPGNYEGEDGLLEEF
ncbi:hypothetical protein F5Y18DRAFT_427597 [Xylariaceae sp. FL1019]|nr:hypothetical protein F5Y18DRAFT_427597 [Xylariaceae sp. FL1019]